MIWRKLQCDIAYGKCSLVYLQNELILKYYPGCVKGGLPETVYFYTRQAYQRRLAKRKNPRNCVTVTELEED
ncbi:hypothetical protein CN354_22345 [Bacillus cereus]|nr:hypothetical protein CN354_22345 [Bacillus cereus]